MSCGSRHGAFSLLLSHPWSRFNFWPQHLLGNPWQSAAASPCCISATNRLFLFLLFPFPVLGPSSSLSRAAGSPLSASLGAPQGMPRPRGQFPRRRQPSAPPVPPLSRAAPFLPPAAREGGKLPCARKSLPGPPSHGFRAQSHTASLPSAITGVPAASRGGENPTQLSQGHRWLPVTSLTPPSWGLPAWRCRFLGEQAWCWGQAAGVTHPIPLGFSPAPL